MSTLRKSFISGIIWGTIEKFSTLFMGFIITLLLARKLTPEDYGLVNMINIFTVFGMVLIDGGFGQALIQKKDVDNKDYSTVFYFNILLSLIMYVFLYYSAPLIAAFYNQPSLTSISRVIFLLFPINAFSIIQHTILTKEMKVRQLTIVSVVSSLVSGVVGIAFAYTGFGVWALVYQTITLYLVRSIVLWLQNDWRPIIIFSINSIKSIWKFSINLLGTFMLVGMFQNIYTVVIGKFFNVSDVGYYNQASRFETIATGIITSSIQRVTFPAFANLQNDINHLRDVYKRVITVTMYMHLPFMLGLAAIGHDMFYILLTEKWIESVPYFYLLCAASSVYPMHMVNVNILKALGKGKLYFWLSLFKYLLMLIFIVLTIRVSITYILIGYVISTFISSLIISYYCGKQINYSLGSQLQDLFPIFISTLFMVFIVFMLGNLQLDIIYRLIIEIIGGIISYLTISYIFNLSAFVQLVDFIKHVK